jgi:hypothetical protein
MTRTIMEAPERLVGFMATGITRRHLLRRSGEAALAAAMAGAFLDKVMIDPAYADLHCWGHDMVNCGVQCKAGDTVCGPSPYCGDNHCHDDGECKDENDFGTRYRDYEGGSCEGIIGNKGNCWCSCSGSGTMRRCCDCCQQNNPGPTSSCTSCPNGETWYRCICHIVVCDNCCS